MRSAAPSGLSARLDLHGVVAQGDDTVDVRDTGCSDQVFQRDGSNLAGFGGHGPSIGFDRGDTGARDPLVGDERRSLATHAEGAADRYCIQVAVR